MRGATLVLSITLALAGCGVAGNAHLSGTLPTQTWQTAGHGGNGGGNHGGGGHTQPADPQDPAVDPQSPDTRATGTYETLATFTVKQILPDRNGHEHLLLAAPSGEGVELAHNLALAPRVPAQVGDSLQIRGEYICTANGDPSFPNDVVHWTHHDPAHHHPDGYIIWHGQTFQ